MEEYRFGIIYINGDDYDDFEITDADNIEPYFNAIPDDSETTIKLTRTRAPKKQCFLEKRKSNETN